MNTDIRAHLGVDHEIEFITTKIKVDSAEAFRDSEGESIVEVWHPIQNSETEQVLCKTCDLFLTGDWRIV